MDYSGLWIYEIIIAIFLVANMTKRSQFFKKTFLLIDISIRVAFGILFLILSNVKISHVY